MKKHLNFLLALILLFAACSKSKTQGQLAQNQEEDISEQTYQFGICTDSLHMTEYRISPGDNLSGIYSNLDFNGAQIDRIVKSTSGLIPPRSLRPGMNYFVFTSSDSIPAVTNIVFGQSKTKFVVITFDKDSISTGIFNKPVTIKRHYSEGTVERSLWNTIVDSGTDPTVAIMLSDIYAWEIDFFGIQKGDEYKVLYDMSYVDDTVALYVESIEGAVFTHNGKNYTAIPFVQDSVRIFFDAEGNSTRRAFLKAPLDFFRITSKFTNARFHPVLKKYRAHHGVDYAAPVGTPVKTIGDGVVIEKAYQKNGGGYYLKIKHNSTYITTYMHLSRYADSIQKGSRVRQGDIIAYVGSSGLSTGPHLDFRVHKNGMPIDPLTMEAPPDIPLKPELKDSFEIVKRNIMEEIRNFSIAYNDTTLIVTASPHPSEGGA